MRTGRPIEYDLDQVLEKAMSLFWRKGYQATSLNDLMEATALSKSSIYHVFGSKRDLFLRCLERYQEKTTADLWQRLSEANNGKMFIRETLTWVIDEIGSGIPPQGCLITNTATEFSQYDEHVARCVLNGLDRYQEIFRAAVKQGKSDGSIRPDADENDLATYLVTSMSGLRTMVKAGSPYSVLQVMVDMIVEALD